MNMETQCGPNDCGVYVSAMMTSIAYGEDPCYLSYNYNPKTMQHQLAQCFEMQELTPFQSSPRVVSKVQRTLHDISKS